MGRVGGWQGGRVAGCQLPADWLFVSSFVRSFVGLFDEIDRSHTHTPPPSLPTHSLTHSLTQTDTITYITVQYIHQSLWYHSQSLMLPYMLSVSLSCLSVLSLCPVCLSVCLSVCLCVCLCVSETTVCIIRRSFSAGSGCRLSGSVRAPCTGMTRHCGY